MGVITVPRVVVDAVEQRHLDILRQLAERQKSDVILVSPLNRFGFSGAKLYQAFFDDNRAGLPFVVKVHEKGAISEELQAISTVKHYFDDCLLFNALVPTFTKTHGAVAYKQITSGYKEGRDQTLELKDLLDDQSVTGTEIAKCMRVLYRETCDKAHGAFAPTAVVPRTEYEQYFRGERARHRIKDALGNQQKQRECTVLGKTILNPLRLLSVGFRSRIEWRIGPVHGDLHTSNVVLDSKRVPHLIDFSWANRTGHILKDYVLMENSIRFMLFPKYVPTEDQLMVDRALLKEDGLEQVHAMRFRSAAARRMFRRMVPVLREVRAAARVRAYRDFREYLAAQFLVLYGLLAYDSYNTLPALRALGLIGRELAGTEYLPSI